MYFIIELQTGINQTINYNVYEEQDKLQAESVFFQKVAEAAISNFLIHAVIMMSNSGELIHQRSYTHGGD